VASASFDKTVKIWDVNSGVCIQTLDHSDWVDSVAYSHDSALLASASHDNTVKIWNARSSQCIQTLVGHTQFALSVAFSHDSTRIASGSSNDKIKIWDVSSGECSQTFQGHSNTVRSIAFSHDSGHLASASYDGTIKIWDTSREVQELEGHSNSVKAIVLSPDSTKVVSACYDEKVKIWDTSSGECLQTHDGSGETITSIALSSDSKWVVLGHASNSDIMILDASSGECVRMLKGHSDAVTSIALCPNSTQVASESYDNTIRIWDIVTGQCLQTLSIGKITFDISFDATGSYLHTSIGSFLIDVSNASSSSDTAPRVMSPKRSLSGGIALSSDQSWITYDSDKLIWLPSEYRSHCWNVSGNTICVGARTGRVWICNIDPIKLRNLKWST
jgi:WD40 repeat protein